MDKKVLAVFKDIKSLKIQGAENVASAAVDALAIRARASKTSTPRQFLADLSKTVSFLKTARPTEPALRNALRYVLLQAKISKSESVPELRRLVEKQAVKYHKNSLETKLKIAEYGSRLVPAGGTVLVHCHSSTVMRVLKKAHDSGKKFSVICPETRPHFQGRISALELSSYGIPTTLVADSAANFFLQQMKDSDVLLVGADAVTSSGDLVNKIGTSLIAQAAFEAGKKVFSCTGLHKFDPLTLKGFAEPIEFRSSEELLADLSAAQKRKFRKIKIVNPAFDVTPAKHIEAYVTELGVIPPQSLLSIAWKEFGFD